MRNRIYEWIVHHFQCLFIFAMLHSIYIHRSLVYIIKKIRFVYIRTYTIVVDRDTSCGRNSFFFAFSQRKYTIEQPSGKMYAIAMAGIHRKQFYVFCMISNKFFFWIIAKSYLLYLIEDRFYVYLIQTFFF